MLKLKEHHRPALKANATVAMRNLIAKVRRSVPFDHSQQELYSGLCRGCAKKLIDYLDMELESWEQKLSDGDVPRLGDVDKMAGRSKKIVRALKYNGLIDA